MPLQSKYPSAILQNLAHLKEAIRREIRPTFPSRSPFEVRTKRTRPTAASAAVGRRSLGKWRWARERVYLMVRDEGRKVDDVPDCWISDSIPLFREIDFEEQQAPSMLQCIFHAEHRVCLLEMSPQWLARMVRLCMSFRHSRMLFMRVWVADHFQKPICPTKLDWSSGWHRHEWPKPSSEISFTQRRVAKRFASHLWCHLSFEVLW